MKGIIRLEKKDCLGHLNQLLPFCLVTTARGGSEFLQSLLDNHPQVCTFNTNFRFFNEYLPASKTWDSDKTDLSDFIDEFIGVEIHRFKTHYFKTERQDQLGPNCNQSINIDTNAYRTYFMSIIDDNKITKKSLFLSIYGAYHMSLGYDILKTKVLFHHAHILQEADIYFNEFPQSKLILTTRDPRAAFVSSINHSSSKDGWFDNYKHVNDSLKNLVLERELFEKLGKDAIIIRLEDTRERTILKSLAAQIHIDYKDSMKVSTWGGLEWWGDRSSPNKLDPRVSKPNTNSWRNKLAKRDKYILETVLCNLLIKYQYPCSRKTWIDRALVRILLFIPLKHEMRHFRLNMILKKLKIRSGREIMNIISIPYYYLKVRQTLFLYLKFQNKQIWDKWPGDLLKTSNL